MQTTSNKVSRNILVDVKANHNITLGEILRLVHHKFQLNFTYNKAWRGRELAREALFGKVEKSYSYVEDLKDDLMRRNHGSHIYVMKDDKDNPFL